MRIPLFIIRIMFLFSLFLFSVVETPKFPYKSFDWEIQYVELDSSLREKYGIIIPERYSNDALKHYFADAIKWGGLIQIVFCFLAIFIRQLTIVPSLWLLFDEILRLNFANISREYSPEKWEEVLKPILIVLASVYVGSLKRERVQKVEKTINIKKKEKAD